MSPTWRDANIAIRDLDGPFPGLALIKASLEARVDRDFLSAPELF
jgi:hypothetical protein